MKFTNMKFDVAAITKELGVPHGEASRIIQEALFEQGYQWYSGGVVQHLSEPYLFSNDVGLISVGWGNENSPRMKQFENCSIKVSYSIHSKPEVVEFNGEMYNKADLEKALALLTPVK